MDSVESFLSAGEEQNIIETIKTAEQFTAGEIRVHLEHECPGDAIKRATEVFYHIGMDGTADQTGVLIYIAVDSHKLAIIGDCGINQKVSEDFWDQCIMQIKSGIVKKDAASGLQKAIVSIGLELAQHFPANGSNPNELPDQISKG